ncbi:MAG: Sir2 silent information regulator family NAD-dependent deacetylase [Clostridiales bacterium]|nr:Sir2 silent information regulator family NAD-dependent deacetylase [Clostridiales bacterium]
MTTTSTEDYSDKIYRLKTAVSEADAVVIGAGAGLSTSGGIEYTGERFQNNFADFIAKYHYNDMYSATFYPYDSLEEYWAYMSRHINMNRYAAPAGKPFSDLLELMKDKNYFVITTNVDHQFQKAGFDKHRLFYTQGDYGLWQCGEPCHNETYDNAETVALMVSEQKDLRIPAELVPQCPKCGKPMSMNLRCDDTFVQDKGWHTAAKRYGDFLRMHMNLKTLYLELGVGGNTPGVIKYPFWKMTAQNPLAVYACVNLSEAVCPGEIQERSVCIDDDAGRVLSDLVTLYNRYF